MTSVPEQWSRGSLGRILSAIEAGKNFRCIEKPPEDGNPGVVKVSAVTWGTFDELESKTCPDPRLLNERYLIRPGDLLISRANTLELVGACVMVGSISRRLMLSDKILRLVMPEELKRWVLWFLRSKAGRAQIEAKASGNQLSMRNIGQDGIRSIELPVAPPVEREQIVAAIESHFSRLDAATATLERVQRNLERYRASVLKAAVEGRLVPTEAELAKKEGRSYEPASVLLKRILAERRRRWEEAELAKLKAKGKPPTDDRWKARYKDPVPPDVEGLPELPEGWCWSSLEQLLSHLTSGSRDWTDYYDRGTGVFLMAQNVRPGRLDLSFVQHVDPPPDDASCARSQVEEGDLLVTIVGANTGDVCRIPRPLPEHYVCQSVALMRPAIRSLSRYLDAYLNSPPGQAVFDRFMYGQGRPHLGFDQLETTPVPLPPADEAERIVDLVDDKISVATAVAAPIGANKSRIARLRQSILKWAFEGRLVQSEGVAGDRATALG